MCLLLSLGLVFFALHLAGEGPRMTFGILKLQLKVELKLELGYFEKTVTRVDERL
jgi:hypothetical protein